MDITEAEKALLEGRFRESVSADPADPRSAVLRAFSALDPSDADGFEDRCSDAEKAVADHVRVHPEDRAWTVSLIERFILFLKERNAFYDYENMVVENIYLESSMAMVSGNYIYTHMRDLRDSVADEPLKEDVDMRSVARIYLELCDIVYTDLDSACRKALNDPSEDNLSLARRCLSLILNLVRYGRPFLTLRSSMSPAAYREWINKLLFRCRSAAGFAEYDGRDPEIDSVLSELSSEIGEINDDEVLSALQDARNRTYLEENQAKIEWGNRAVEELGRQLEACDPYDFTQRKYLIQLINTTNDWLNSFHKDR